MDLNHSRDDGSSIWNNLLMPKNKSEEMSNEGLCILEQCQQKDPQQVLKLAMMKDNVATRRTIQPWRDSPIQLLFQDQDTSFLSYPSFGLSSLAKCP